MRLLLITGDGFAGLLPRRDSSFQIDEAEDAEDAISLAKLNYDYEAIVARRYMVGDDFPRRLRTSGCHQGLIMLIGTDDVDLRIKLLSTGADRCLQVPLDVRELAADLHAVIRRCNQMSDNLIKVRGLKMDIGSKTVWANNNIVELTNREFKLLEYMMLHKGQTCAKESILESMYGIDCPDLKIIDVFMCKVRKKLRTKLDYEPIGTIWGMGYRMLEDVA